MLDARKVLGFIPSAFFYSLFKKQKKMKFNKENNTPFLELSSKVTEVHGNAGMTALLFSIASIFKDIIVEETDCFPLLHLYGVPSTGKSRLAHLCKKIEGVNQKKPYVLGPESFEDFQVLSILKHFHGYNGIVCLEEYYPDNSRIDALLKKIHDSEIITLKDKLNQVVSIRNKHTAIVTGNHLTSDASLYSRMIVETMSNTVFSDKQTEAFHDLNDFVENKLGCVIEEIKSKRPFVEREFKFALQSVESIYGSLWGIAQINYRILMNVSILAAIYRVLEEELNFSFSNIHMHKHFIGLIDKQMDYLKILDKKTANNL